MTPKDLIRLKRELGVKYADLVYNGLWFSPMRQAIDAFVATMQPQVTGQVRLRLYKGECRVVGRRSPYALYDRVARDLRDGRRVRPRGRRRLHQAVGPAGRDRGPAGGEAAAQPPRRTAAPGSARARRGHGRAAIVADWVGRWPSDVMANLWSGRFGGDPDADVFEFGRSFSFDRRLFEDDVRGSLAWVEAIARRPARSPPPTRRRSPKDCAAILEEGTAAPGFLEGADEDVHAFVERKLVERIGEAGKRLHTGPLAQRAGVGRSAAVPEAPDPGPAGRRWSALVAALAGQAASRRTTRRCRPTRTCGARSPCSSRTSGWRTWRPCGATTTHWRSRRTPPTSCRSARARWPARATRSTSPALARRLGLLARRAQQHRRLVGPRLRVGLPARLLARDGAPQPPGRGPDHLHRRGVPLLRAVRRGGDGQQPDAAEEEPGSARVDSREGGARDRPPHRAG